MLAPSLERHDSPRTPVEIGQLAPSSFHESPECARLPSPLAIAHAGVDDAVNDLNGRNLGNKFSHACPSKAVPAPISDTFGATIRALEDNAVSEMNGSLLATVREAPEKYALIHVGVGTASAVLA